LAQVDTPIDLSGVYEVRQGIALSAAIDQAREIGSGSARKAPR
jgi:hypothetical protein